jgi:hypothetical protein
LRERSSRLCQRSPIDAKKASEVAPGVGPATDMAIVTDGGLKVISDDTLKVLLQIFNESQGKKPSSLDKLSAELNKG